MADMKLISIIRNVEPESCLEIALALREEGITSMECSLSDPERGFGCLEILKRNFTQDQLHFGAGTVLYQEEVNRLADMGIPFMLTPGLDLELTVYAREKGIDVIPGVLTPTDVTRAVTHGIRLLKLFPANAFGMGYLKALKGPFPETSYLAVGGVDADHAADYFKAGFAGIAVGSCLVPQSATRDDIPKIRMTARKLVAAANGGNDNV